MLRRQWAEEWATFLERWDCSTSFCRMPQDDWVAEYDALCEALDPSGVPTPDMAAHIGQLPPLAGPVMASRQLTLADAVLVEPGLADERIAELQQTRLDAMIQLGISEACHPDIG